jgi:molybdopterin-dependent oxidoreductase alpha subunit
MNLREGLAAQAPIEPASPRLKPPKGLAAGLPAVLATAKHVLAEMPPIRGLSVLAHLNQEGGFDCQGCAWPDPDGARSPAEFCENGAKAAAEEATVRKLTPEFFAVHTVQELSQRSDYWLGKRGRLTEPMILRDGSDHYEPISWENAFEHIGKELHSLADPNRAAFYTSGRTSNEAAFLYQLFVRLFGTNNLPDCSNMCHESSGIALSETIGVGKGTVLLDDFDQAELIIVIGQNPGTNHPRMLTSLERAKRRGCKLVSINPLPEAGMSRFKNPQDFRHPVKGVRTLLGQGTALADVHVSVRLGGDGALIKGVMKELLVLENEEPGSVVDAAFIGELTEGYEALVKDLESQDWAGIVEASGVTLVDIRELAQLVAGSSRIICCWAMGLTQHREAVATIQEIVNLLLMRGAIGKPGAGLCPVRGHSNVQGDRTMGIWERVPEEFLDRLADAVGFEPPREHGLDTVGAICAMHEGKIDVFVAMGGNFLSAAPDTEFTADALKSCALTVQISTKLNRSHLITGAEALILPCLGRTERDFQESGPQFVTVENSFGVVHRSSGHLAPTSESLRSEPAIVAGLAQAVLGREGPVGWDALVANYDRVRDLIAEVVPGAENYNVRVRSPGGFVLPNGARDRRFDTQTGRARFTVHPLTRLDPGPGRYIMMTIRSHDQYNTTIYGLDDRYRGIHGGRRVVLMNPDDITKEGLVQGEAVDIESHFENRKRSGRGFFVVPYLIPRGCVATYFPEANVLVPVSSVARKSNTPTSKSVAVSIASAV